MTPDENVQDLTDRVNAWRSRALLLDVALDDVLDMLEGMVRVNAAATSRFDASVPTVRQLSQWHAVLDDPSAPGRPPPRQNGIAA